MRYRRHYIQYNDLVFDEIDMVDEDSYSAAFKSFESSYGFAHGSYMPQKKKGGLLRSGSVSMTLVFRMRKLPCEDRPYYIRFAKGQLTTQGKLWAVQDNTLIWANAYLTSYRESANSSTDELEIDVSFTLPEGVWHKANTLRTFLLPYDPCDFMDCYDFRDVELCRTHCCDCEKKQEEKKCLTDTRRHHCGSCEGDCCTGECVPATDCDCGCDTADKEDALCFHKEDIQRFYDPCGAGFRILYSCRLADKYFSDFLSDNHVGQKYCNECGGTIAGILYSDTDIPTEGVKIVLHGQMHDPYIEINGNGNYIRGDYDGVLEIHPDGSVYSHREDCHCDEPLPVDVWAIPAGMDYGWTVEQGNNRLIIDPGSCCHVCAWIEVDALTI